ncbi:hypothetical protein SNEBB_001022 [Seison nebaliae]|nr:hypothetical protein SNEBB_001022 [Seison nebaliae]
MGDDRFVDFNNFSNPFEFQDYSRQFVLHRSLIRPRVLEEDLADKNTFNFRQFNKQKREDENRNRQANDEKKRRCKRHNNQNIYRTQRDNFRRVNAKTTKKNLLTISTSSIGKNHRTKQDVSDQSDDNNESILSKIRSEKCRQRLKFLNNIKLEKSRANRMTELLRNDINDDSEEQQKSTTNFVASSVTLTERDLRNEDSDDENKSTTDTTTYRELDTYIHNPMTSLNEAVDALNRTISTKSRNLEKNNESQQLYQKLSKDDKIYPSAAINKQLENEEFSGNYLRITDQQMKLLKIPLIINTTIVKLDLTECPIDMDGFISLCHIINENTTIKSYILDDIRMDDPMPQMLYTAIANNRYINHLSLNGCNLGKSSINFLAQLSHNSLNIETIQMERNHLYNHKDFFLLTDDTSMTELNMGWNSLCNFGALSLWKAFQKNSTLKHLNLAMNAINEDAIRSTIFENFMKKNSNLQTMNLSLNNLGNGGVHRTIELFLKNQYLLELNLSHNGMNAGKMTEVIEMIDGTIKSKFQSIKTIYLEDISIEYIMKIKLDNLEKNFNVKILFDRIFYSNSTPITPHPAVETFVGYPPILDVENWIEFYLKNFKAVFWRYIKIYRIKFIPKIEDILKKTNQSKEKKVNRQVFREAFSKLKLPLPFDYRVLDMIFTAFDLNKHHETSVQTMVAEENKMEKYFVEILKIPKDKRSMEQQQLAFSISQSNEKLNLCLQHSSEQSKQHK